MLWHKAFQYRLHTMLPPLAWYFGVLFVLNVVIWVMFKLLLDVKVESALTVTLFFTPIVAFMGLKNRISFLLQNSFSRKSIYISEGLGLLSLSILANAGNVLLELIFAQKLNETLLFSLAYGIDFGVAVELFWYFSFCFLLISISLLLSSLFVRLHVAIKILLLLAIPFVGVLVFVLLMNVPGFSEAFVQGWNWYFAIDSKKSPIWVFFQLFIHMDLSTAEEAVSPVKAGVHFLCTALLLFAVNFLVLRRLTLQEK